MVYGTMTMTYSHLLTGIEGLFEIFLGLADSLVQPAATGQEGGDGRRQSTAGTVGIWGVDGGRTVFVTGAVGGEQAVGFRCSFWHDHP